MYHIFLTQYNGMVLGPIAKLLGFVLNTIYNLLANIGITNAAVCIILFTFIVKALMIPLTIKQQKFTKISSIMNPEIQKIQAKYKGKKDQESMRKQQLETQAVYQKYGASPTSGCLPLLITLPILLALYRVIYNIPAYVNAVYDLYANIALPIKETSGHVEILKTFADAKVNFDKFVITDGSMTITNIIDVLSNFKTTDWALLIEKMPNLTNVIHENSKQIMHINSFVGGLNIADKAGLAFPGILIPIAAAFFQWLQTKLVPMQNDESNPAASTMKTMNTVMPIMTGVMCVAFPVGLGLYWIASSVFQILQQIAVNKYMDKIDVNELIEKNVEKAKNKKVKLGIDPNASMEELAKKNTRTINPSTSNIKNNASKKTNYEASNYKKSEVSYKEGSIAANANLLKNKKGTDKGDNE